ncbi:unnamed protein product [Urochloa humidicola]
MLPIAPEQAPCASAPPLVMHSCLGAVSVAGLVGRDSGGVVEGIRRELEGGCLGRDCVSPSTRLWCVGDLDILRISMVSSNACTRRNHYHGASKHYASPSVQPWQLRQDAGKLHCSLICSTPLLDLDTQG